MKHEILDFTKEEVIEKLKSGDCVLDYFKLSDDKLKQTLGTLNPSVITYYGGKIPTGESKTPEENIVYFDTQAYGWRSFYFQNLRFISTIKSNVNYEQGRNK